MKKPWYTKFFDETYLTYFTGKLDPELTNCEVDFMVDKLGLAAGRSILDLCCGHGRHAIELAQRGYAVTGQDLSKAFLAKARKEAAACGVAVRWVHSDMRQIPFENEFDACVNWFTAFGYLETDEEDQKALNAIQRALKPGGTFLLDTINHAWLMRNFAPRGWMPTPENGILLEERHFDSLTGCNLVKVTFVSQDGERKTSEIKTRVYTLVELSKMLSAAGLSVVDAWGDIDGSPYSLNSHRMIVLARK